MNRSDAEAILSAVHFPGFTFRVVGQFDGAIPTYLQASFMAPCNDAGGEPVQQRTRKWLLSKYMTRSELVRTAFKCVLTAIEHEARERFRYRGVAIFGPHHDVDVLVRMAGHEDVRP